MRREDRVGRGRCMVGKALRREASAEQPPFSERFHDRLVERLPAGRPPRLVAAASVRVPLGRWAVMTLAVSAAALILFVAQPGGEPVPADSLTAGAAAATAENTGHLAVAAAEPDESLGIDRLPTPGEIEEEVRASVTELAASLLDVPKWTALADFDAGVLLEDGGR